LGLRLGVAQGRFRRFSEVRFLSGLIDERRFGLGRTPGFGRYAAEGDACSGYFPTGNREHNGGRSQNELVRRPGAQFQIVLFASRNGWWQRHVRDEVARLEHGLAMRCVAGYKVEVSDGDSARILCALYMNGRL